MTRTDNDKTGAQAMPTNLETLHSEVVEYLWTELHDGDADMPEGVDEWRDEIAAELWRDIQDSPSAWRKVYACAKLIGLLRLDELPFKDGQHG